MLKKKLACVVISILMLSIAAVPAYAVMPDGSLEHIAVNLSEGQVATFKLPDLPPQFTDTYEWINGIIVTTTQYRYEPSMWFKIYVPSGNQEIEWALSGVSSETFTDYISVIITHEDDLHTSRCFGFWKVAKNAVKTEKIAKAGTVYIQLCGSDVTTDLRFSFSLRDYVPTVEESIDTIVDEPINTNINESSGSPTDNTQDTETREETEIASETKPQINLDSASSWARDAIRNAVLDGYVPVGIQGDYTRIVTRAEFCRMAVKWLEYATGMSIDAILSEQGVSRDLNAFTDTSDSDILAAYALGITSGTGNRQFTPHGDFSREQAATMIRNTCKVLGADTNNPPASGFVDLSDASRWAVDGINFCRANGIMNGTSSVPLLFSPKSTYTRQESIVTFSNIWPDGLPKAVPYAAPAQPIVPSAPAEPETDAINQYMLVNVGATSQLALCEYRDGDFYTTTTWIRKDEEVFVYGVTTKEHSGLVMAKVNYSGEDGWVAYMWLTVIESSPTPEPMPTPAPTPSPTPSPAPTSAPSSTQTPTLESELSKYTGEPIVASANGDLAIPIYQYMKVNTRMNGALSNSLPFFSKPSTATCYKLGDVPNDTTVYVYGVTVETFGGFHWALIDYNGQFGCVFAKWIEDSTAAPSPVDPPPLEPSAPVSENNQKLDNICDEIISKTIKSGMSERDKVKAIHDYIVLNCAYDYDNYRNGTIPETSYTAYGLLTTGKGVCQSYAEAAKALLDRIGIECMIVSGTANSSLAGSGGHAWNIVKINGNYYHMDATWDDPVPDKANKVRYDYFLLTDEQISKNHSWDRNGYPECTTKDSGK